ncbi:MAG: FtsX-like permease family protein, partial [Holophagales bacterium]|nr:FtsX-like permease family protein [Holophagales bacterium]
DGESMEVVGVLAPGSRLGNREIEIWTPFALPSAELDRRSHYLPVLARLAPGSSLEAARREATRVAAELEREHPESNEGWTATAIDYRESVVGSVRAVLWALFAAVFLVLAICCSNVASLLLARATARSPEASLRAALGASRWRLIRLFLLEGLTVTAIGGAVGIAVAWWGAGLLAYGSRGLLPMATEIEIDPAVVAFGLTLVLGTGVLVGLVPAWRFAREAPAGVLRAAPGRGVSRASARFRGALTLVQTGLALVLLVAGGLALEDLRRLQANELGFEPENVAAVQVSLHPVRYAESSDQIRFFETLLEEMGDGSEVLAAGAGSALPLRSRGRNSLSYRPLGSAAGLEDTELVGFTAVTPGYFRTLGIPLLRGRAFGPEDREDSRPVAIVNHALAERAWPGSEPIGQRLEMNIRGSDMTELEVVGVSSNTLETDLRASPRPSVFVPFRQFPHAGMILVFRSSLPDPILRRTEARIFELDPEQPIYESFQVSRMVEEAGQRDRLFVTLFSIFGGFGLLLVMTGVYGVVLYTAQQREQEIGIRVALGAGRARLFRELLRGSLLPALFGLGIGLVAAVLASRYLEGFLSEADARDPTIFALGVVGLAAALLAAGLSAGLRILRRDPARLLRQE